MNGNSTRFRTLAIALTLFFGFVIMVLSLSIHQLSLLQDLEAVAQHTSASDAIALGTTRLMWFQGLAIGTGMLLLAALLFHVFQRLGVEEQAVTVAHQETQHILSTVNEGLFLLDRDLVIGAEHSAVLNTILRREDLAGMKLPDLLRDMVPGKTLTTALDFVDLLWSDRVEADLIEDINPLNEVETHFAAKGGFETRYLKFSFKRVSVGADVAHILVSVTDISEPVKLRLELQHAQAASEAQMDLLMSILHVPPQQLHAFLGDSEASLRQANAILMEQSSSAAQFKEKITQLFRAVHGVKSDAAGLGLPTIEAKAHSFEDELQRLREHTELSGRDLLDLPIKLDDLLSHFTAIRSLVERLGALRSAFDAPGATTLAQPAAPSARRKIIATVAEGSIDTIERTQRLPAPELIEQTVVPLAERIASELGKRVNIRTNGLTDLPEAYRSAVKDVVVQLVRNAVVHGIESPEERTTKNKLAAGRISIDVAVDTAKSRYQVSVEDDGRGLSSNRILAAALRKGLVTTEEAKHLQGAKVLHLIFKPGFTTAEQVTEHAGRGVGMDIVKTRVESLGGRIAIGGERGRRTVFRISLPMLPADAAAA